MRSATARKAPRTSATADFPEPIRRSASRVDGTGTGALGPSAVTDGCGVAGGRGFAGGRGGGAVVRTGRETGAGGSASGAAAAVAGVGSAAGGGAHRFVASQADGG